MPCEKRIPNNRNVIVRFDGKEVAIVSAQWIPDGNQLCYHLFGVVLLHLRGDLTCHAIKNDCWGAHLGHKEQQPEQLMNLC